MAGGPFFTSQPPQSEFRPQSPVFLMNPMYRPLSEPVVNVFGKEGIVETAAERVRETVPGFPAGVVACVVQLLPDFVWYSLTIMMVSCP